MTETISKTLALKEFFGIAAAEALGKEVTKS